MSSNAENPHHLPTITTIAGTGKAGYDGDDKAATSARLYSPYGVAVDAYGNIYIADYGNNRLRKVDLNGNIDTIVDGNNAPTYIGYYVPSGVAVDSHGNIYFADPSNGCIYKKDSSSSIIYRIAGTEGKQGYTGDGGPADKATFLWPYGPNFNPDNYRLFTGEPTHILVDNEVIDLGERKLRVIHTPGHSPGHNELGVDKSFLQEVRKALEELKNNNLLQHGSGLHEYASFKIKL